MVENTEQVWAHVYVSKSCLSHGIKEIHLFLYFLPVHNLRAANVNRWHSSCS